MSELSNIEPILQPDDNRYVMFPIEHDDVWQMYKKQVDCFWRAEEVDLSKDLKDWDKLNTDEQKFIKMVRIINYKERQKEDGDTFFVLELQGGIEMVQSKETGNFYATAKRAFMPSTFDEQTCSALIVQKCQVQ